jgi:hypothetical protein
VGDEWEIVDTPGGASGLPRKTRSIKVTPRSKPKGTPGRTAPEGYNLQWEIRAGEADYRMVYVSPILEPTSLCTNKSSTQRDAKTIAQRTNAIDMTLAMSFQTPGAVDLCVQKVRVRASLDLKLMYS